MPLANFLSAVRELILDTDTFAENIDDRVSDYTDRFPLLTADEINDLANITPQRLKIYTSTIFHGEKSTLLNHFACSFAFLEKYWEEAYGRSFSAVSLVRALHRRYPWDSHQTLTLAHNYVRYVSEALTDIHQTCPWIVDLTRLELTSLITKRAHSSLEAKDSLQEDELIALTVEEILSLTAHVPEYVHFERFSFDVVGIARSYHQQGELATASTLEHAQIAACGRNEKLYPRWVRLDPTFGDWLEERRTHCGIAVEEIADLFLNSLASVDDSEEEVFVTFLSTMATLIRAGILVLSTTDNIN